MRVDGTDAAARVVERARAERRGALVFTIGTGCCESTAPFLYEDFWPGPDQEVVGEVAGVPVYAPEYLRRMYPGDDGVVIDVEEGLTAESMSIETAYDCRFVLRDRSGAPVRGDDAAACATAGPAAGKPVPGAVSALRPLGPVELPEPLRRARMR